jgi:hypothetical protein
MKSPGATLAKNLTLFIDATGKILGVFPKEIPDVERRLTASV